MGISNQIPNSRLAQPGVCTSTTRPASPFEGQVIYETDTNRVLVYDASAWVMIADTDQPPGSQLIKSQTVGSAVTSVPVSDVFSSEYDNYTIILSGGSGSTDQGALMTLGSTNTGYYYAGKGRTYAGVDANIDNNNALGYWYVGETSANGMTGVIQVIAPNLATRTQFMTTFMAPRTTGYHYTASGFLNNTTQYTGFTISFGANTQTGGTIRVYGYRN